MGYIENQKSAKTIDAMEKYGGNFVKSLAACFRLADPINYFRLKKTFANYWVEYESMAEKEI